MEYVHEQKNLFSHISNFEIHIFLCLTSCSQLPQFLEELYGHFLNSLLSNCLFNLL